MLSVGNAKKTEVITGMVREIRPWQWYKQSMILLGIIFSRNLLSFDAWMNTVLAIFAFSAVASSIYVYNDISDIEEDRKHPVKQNRPIASGQVGVQFAATFGALLFVGGLGLGYLLGTWFLLILVVYIIQNILYSLYLKHVVIADVLVIAVGFVLRAVAGVVAIGVSLSPWLVVCSFLAALLLAIGKRRHEMTVTENPVDTRSTLAEYEPETLDQLLVVTISTLLISYSLYTFFGTTNQMMITLPFAFFATFRYQHLVHTSNVSGDPSQLMTDRPFILNLSLWGIAVTMVLYEGVNLLLTIASSL